MAFKQKPIINARLDQLSKAELIRTVKTLRKRETKLLNQIARLEVNNLQVQSLLSSEGVIEELSECVVHVTQDGSWPTKAFGRWPWEKTE